MNLPRTLIASCLFLFLLSWSIQAQGRVYWGDYSTGEIYRSNLDGANLTVIVTGATNVRGISVDPKGKRLYWVTSNGVVASSDLDGTNQQTLFTGMGGLWGIEVDELHRKLYLSGGSLIQCSDLNGVGLRTVLSGISVTHMTLDPFARKIYWSGADSVHWANMDGTGAAQIWSGGQSTRGLAVDLKNKSLYWVDFGLSQVFRANLNGSGAQAIASSPNTTQPWDIAANPQEGRVYWTDFDLNNILSADSDGANFQPVVNPTPSPTPHGIDLDVSKVDFPLTIDPPTPGTAGTDNDFFIDGASPQQIVRYYFGLKPGNSPAPGCGGTQLGLHKRGTVGVVVADPFGSARITRFVPQKASGRLFYFQAVDQQTCEISHLMSHRF